MRATQLNWCSILSAEPISSSTVSVPSTTISVVALDVVVVQVVVDHAPRTRLQLAAVALTVFDLLVGRRSDLTLIRCGPHTVVRRRSPLGRWCTS